MKKILKIFFILILFFICYTKNIIGKSNSDINYIQEKYIYYKGYYYFVGPPEFKDYLLSNNYVIFKDNLLYIKDYSKHVKNYYDNKIINFLLEMNIVILNPNIEYELYIDNKYSIFYTNKNKLFTFAYFNNKISINIDNNKIYEDSGNYGIRFKKENQGITDRKYIFNNIDSPYSVDDIINKIDNINNYNYLITKNNYEPNNLGLYDINLKISNNNNNNNIFLNLKVDNRDIEPPYIESSTVFRVSYKNLHDEDYFLKQLIIKDNYDKDINVKVLLNNYKDNYNVIGEYEIVLHLEDLSNNIRQSRLKINVIDDVAPVISGPKNIITNTKNQLNNILEKYTVIDEIDKNLTYNNLRVVKDEYTKNKNVEGTYLMILEVSDNFGNKTNYDINIHVEDNNYPLIAYDGMFLEIKDAQSMSIEDIILYLQTNKLLPYNSNMFNVELIESNYVDNINGIYDFKFKILNLDDNSVENKEFKIDIKNLKKEDDIVIDNKKKNYKVFIIPLILLSIIFLIKKLLKKNIE